MIPLSALSAPSDVVAFVSLATLAIVFGALAPERIASIWSRKRYEVVLIWAVAGLHRCAELLHLGTLGLLLHLASAVVAALAAFTAVRSLVRRSRRGG